MSRVVLVQALPRKPADGLTVAVRLAGGGQRGFTHLGAADWLDGIISEPRFTAALGFTAEGWTSGAVPQTTSIGFSPADPAVLDKLSALVWPGAELLVQVGDDEAAQPAWQVALRGTVAGATIRNGVLLVTASDLSGKLATAIAPVPFAGTGGLEGGPDAIGRTKRRSWGRVFGIEGRLLDKASNIYEFGDPLKPLQAFVAVKDRGRSGDLSVVAWQGSPAATLAALQASTPPSGGAAVAPSIACAKWWGTPAGPLTADLLGEVGAGYVETVSEIAARVVGSVSALTLANVAAMAQLRPLPAGWHVDSLATTAASVLDGILLGASMAWSMTPAGVVEFLPIGVDGPAELLDFDSIERAESFAPVIGVRVAYAANNRIHNDGEISAAVLAGDVAGLGPLAVAPSVHFGSPLLLESDGGSQASLADFKTALGTASAITGQGALATMGSVAFGTPYLLEGAGGAFATLSAFKTALGVASGFVGQGSLATLSSLAFGGQYLTGFGALAGLGELFFGSPLLREASGGTGASLTNFKTSLGIASGFLGQGAFATLNSLFFGSPMLLEKSGGDPASLPISGTNLAANPEFYQGTTGWQRYDNRSTGKVALSIVADATSPNGSGSVMKITYTPGAGDPPTPGFGGVVNIFNKADVSKPNCYTPGATIYRRIIAKVPLGRSVFVATNSLGTGGGIATLTDTAGTGGWKEYIFKYTIGTTGTYGNTGHFYVGGGADEAFDWFIAKDDWIDARSAQKSFLGSTFDENGVRRAGSDLVTLLGTASAITGQGAFATLSSAAYGSPLLTGFGALAPLGELFFGSPLLREATGGTSASLANFKTSLGTASAILGQGTLATVSTVQSQHLGLGSVLPSRMGSASAPTNIIADPTFQDPAYWAMTINAGGAASLTLGTGSAAARAAMGVSRAATISLDGTTPTVNVEARVNANRGAVIPSAGGETLTSQFSYYIEQAFPDNAGDLIMTVRAVKSDGSADSYFQNVMPLKGMPAGTTDVRPLTFKLPTNTVSYHVYFTTTLKAGTPMTGIVHIGAPSLAEVSVLGRSVTRADGATLLTDALAVTSLGTASGIAGQGAFATISSAAYGSSLLTGFGALAPLGSISLGQSFLRRADGTTTLTEALAVTSLGTAAAITGQGPGATATGPQVLNNSTAGSLVRIAQPEGGRISSGSSTLTGAIKIKLPQSWSNTMMKFRVEIYNYSGGASVSYDIAGYNYTGTGSGGFWDNYSAQMTGADARRRTVRFGHDGDTCCVWIGEPTDTWQYPKIAVLDFQGGQSLVTEAAWAAGWAVSFDAVAPTAITGTVTNPNAGEGVFGVNMLEQRGGVAATTTNFKTSLGTASAFTGQTAWATYSGLNPSNVALQVQYMQLDGNLEASRIYDGGGEFGTLRNVFPAQRGANVTGTNTAAAITGQGAFATVSALTRTDIGNPGNPWFNLNAFSFGSTITRENGSTKVTDSLAITSLGTASAITGQTSWATYNGLNPGNVALQVQYLQLDGLLEASRVYDGGGEFGSLRNVFPAQRGANVTGFNTAAGIFGQGALATSSIPLAPSGLINHYSIDNYGVGRLNDYWPEEGGANKTETRPAAAITGQGAFATVSALSRTDIGNPGNPWFNLNAFSLNYTVRRADGTSVVTESLSITALGVSAGITGQGALATKDQAGAADIAPSAVQLVTYRVLQAAVNCPVGN